MTATLFRPSRRNALGLIGAALVFPRSADADAVGAISGAAFGTTWRVVGPRQADLEHLRAGIDALFASVDQQMSPWRVDSGLSRFNAMPAGWQLADAELIHVTTSALSLARSSEGAFDPTVGPLVAQWGFGPIEGGGQPDWRGISIGDGRIGKVRDDLTLDLCGIAKGRALDRAVELAKNAGLDNLLFDLGGELKALGHHPSGRVWHVAVQNPMPNGAAPTTLRLPAGQAVATSGLSTQSYVLGAHTYGHIIDPAMRVPADAGLLSVTVLAEDAMTADGWATALFAVGLKDGPAVARANGVSALFLGQDGAALSQVTTGTIAGLLL